MNSPTGADWARELRRLMEEAVRAQDAHALLFSAGLDTTLIAYLARDRGLAAITVSVAGRAKDEIYAARVAREFELTHVWVRTDFTQVLSLMPQTVRLLKTFDPMTLRNTVATHAGLLAAQEMNLRAVMTGDAADELFAGYHAGFSGGPEELGGRLRKMWRTMRFSTIELGRALGLEVWSPYLDRRVRDFAERVPPELLREERGGKRHGKAVLRRAFAGEIAEDLLWREKTPLEAGSGTAGLTEFLERKVPDDEFRRESAAFLKTDGVRLRDKEQFYYYKLYRGQFGAPEKAGRGARGCPDCGAAAEPPDHDFCWLCGAWPVP